MNIGCFALIRGKSKIRYGKKGSHGGYCRQSSTRASSVRTEVKKNS